ncbi:MAG: hypothetical protein J7M14_07855, partial [Planctomycetes bacterium]|nr:hypothetical protein [Planctomycetota bacterium]
NSWAKAHYKGDQIKLRKLEQKIKSVETKIIKETGIGVPPLKYLKPIVTPQMKEVVTMAKKAPDWLGRIERAVGQGTVDIENPNRAQAELMAYRAAALDARRKLAEQIEGLMITSNTSVRDFIAESDEISSSMMTFQAGAYEVEGSRKIENNVATVAVEIELKPLWNSIIFYKKKLGLTIK